MASVLRWVLRKDVDEAVELTSGTDGHFLAADTIEGVLTTDARERSGIFSTAANLLAAYRNPAALQATIEPNFDPEAFVRSSDTVYICAPAAEQDLLAPIVIAFLEALRRLTYLRPPGCPPVLFVLDEVANIAPLPQLPSLVAEGGSQGLETVACLQDLSQARARWGPAADGFLTLFGWKMLLPGIADMRTLQLVSALAGDVDVVMRSVTATYGVHGGSSVTRHAERRPRLPIDEVAKIPPGFSLLLGPGSGPALLQLRPVWEDYWQKILDGTWERDVASGKFAR
jgi:type IV secretory pathway TraG/TraD family ATPase VirD4